MKLVTISTECIADVSETWTFKVPDSWEPPPNQDATIDVLTNGGFVVDNIEDEVNNERERVILEVSLDEPGSLGPDE